MATLIAGTTVGMLTVVFFGYWRGTGLGIAYGASVAGIVWAAGWLIAASEFEEMGAIPYLVAGGTAFWFVAIPAIVTVLLLEWRRAHSGR